LNDAAASAASLSAPSPAAEFTPKSFRVAKAFPGYSRKKSSQVNKSSDYARITARSAMDGSR
jgi:hypothetical protein